MKRVILYITLIAGLAIGPLSGDSTVSAQGTAEESASSASGTSTLRVTLRGCEDGIDPETNPESCDVPLDAPERAGIFHPDSQSYPALVSRDAMRENDGTYVIPNLPSGSELHLTDFMPSEHNYFLYDGVDRVDEELWKGVVTLNPDETRSVTIYYWNGAEGLIQPGESTISVLLRGCPEGVDPTVDASECTIPLDAPEAAAVGQSSGTGRAVKLADYERREDGAYQVTINPYDELTVSDLGGVNHSSLYVENADSADDASFKVRVVRNETRDVTVYYYNADDSGTGGEETATLKITFRGCPPGVDPATEAEACTTPLDAPPAAVAQWYSGASSYVADYEREYDGAYVIDGITDESADQAGPPYVVSLSGYAGTEHEGYLFVGVDRVESDDLAIVELQPGEVREVTVYYYNLD